MKLLTWVLFALLSSHTALAAFSFLDVKRETNMPVVPNRFIIEMDTLTNVGTKRSPHVSPHEVVYASLKKRGIGFNVDKEFNVHDLFVGVALTLNDPQDFTALQDTPGVKAIRAVKIFKRPNPVKKHVMTPNNTAIPPDTQSTHVLTGVDKLHAQNITGKGIKIGIIDTGIDYTHPALGGGFGPGHKVIGGTDLVGDNYNGTNTPEPDDDPLDQCAGHGTHVAGIAGANPNNEFNISGVAYEASLSAYRVFGCNGSVADDVLVDALLLGFQDKQDILTLSLGGADGWTESSGAVVASRIASKGVVVTIAAGNDGDSGSWYASSPGSGIDVISVASLDNTIIPLQNATVNGVAHDPITYFATLPLPITGHLPIFATSNSTNIEDDACNALPRSTPDLSGFLVIVRRGGCAFTQKVTNIVAKGAKAALIYDNGAGFVPIEVGKFSAASIQATDGEFLVSQFVAGVPVTISFPQTGASVNFHDPSGGLISSFTSYGPSNDFFFKPSIAAPGGNILSTLPVNLGSFGVLSGTSMATPFVAGSAALLLSVKGNSTAIAKSARSLFETTAQRVPSNHTDGAPLQTLTQQGAGLINVFDAIHTNTILSPSQLILNDTTHLKAMHTFTVTNTGNTVMHYNVSHIPAGTAITVTPGTIFAAKGPVPLSTKAASVSLSHKTITVSPGKTGTITALFTLPAGDQSTFPVYSGFIQLRSGSERTHVSYIGLGASLKNKQVLDDTDSFLGIPLPAVLNSTGGVQEKPTKYTFKDSDFPTFLYRLAFGTPVLRMDLVDSKIKLSGTLNSRAEKMPMLTFPHVKVGGSFEQVKTIGPLVEFDFITRNNEGPDNGSNTFALEKPVFANGTRIPTGSYKVLIRALRVTGNPALEADYDSWLSPIIKI